MLFLLAASDAYAAPVAKPVFDGTFGANCPPCKEFGSTVLSKLYAADGIADAVEFRLHSAIRSAGKLRAEGKEYVMRDGDIVHFLFNV